MASFRCYDNSDVIAFLIMTNFHLYLIKLWWQFFQMFVCGDVVMLRIGRYWPWKTVAVSSHLHMPVRPMLLHRMALVSFRLYVSGNFGQIRATCENFLGKWFTTPPGKNSRTPMVQRTRVKFMFANKLAPIWKAARKCKSWARFDFYVYARPSIHCLIIFTSKNYATVEILPLVSPLNNLAWPHRVITQIRFLPFCHFPYHLRGF